MACVYCNHKGICYFYEGDGSIDTDPVGWDEEGICVVEDDEDPGYSCEMYEDAD